VGDLSGLNGAESRHHQGSAGSSEPHAYIRKTWTTSCKIWATFLPCKTTRKGCGL